MDCGRDGQTNRRHHVFKRDRKWAIGSFAVALCLPLVAIGSASAKETVIYNFQANADGLAPYGSVVADKRGNLFGITGYGGTGTCTLFLGNGCGTVFELSPHGHGSWTESVLYSFKGGSDGKYPEAALVLDPHGNLYGTTTEGGTGNCSNLRLDGCGTVFELSPQGDGTWAETVLYDFQGSPGGVGNGDAAAPNSLVFDTSGNLFGFSNNGGACTSDGGDIFCGGAAFELHKHAGTWREKVIYRADDATAIPDGATFDAQGYLYGSSYYAGPESAGDVFRLAPPSGKGPWTAQILYTFQNGNDGATPSPGFVFDTEGNLYGSSGGTDSVAGNVFELSPTGDGPWTESVLFSFINEGFITDAFQGPIMDTKGDLYGATATGGANGFGLVYKVSKKNGAWSGKILHDFAGGSDGSDALSGVVIGKDGALYGTTAEGGTGAACRGGCGTVFRVTR